jgi:hypothetical protein
MPRADSKGLTITVQKETAVNYEMTESEQDVSAETGALLDGGQASQVTKGVPFLILFELGWPPFDRLLL